MYLLESFLAPLRPTDTNVRLRDSTLAVKYNIRPCVDVQINAVGVNLRIKMKSDTKDIILDFPTASDARAAILIIKNALEQTCKVAKAAGVIDGGGPGNGGGGKLEYEKIFIISTNGQLIFPFDVNDQVNSVKSVFINGVKIDDNEYSLINSALTFSSLPYIIETTDTLSALYLKN